MTYKFYKKQPMLMCEIKLNPLLHKSSELISCLNRFFSYPLVEDYAHIP